MSAIARDHFVDTEIDPPTDLPVKARRIPLGTILIILLMAAMTGMALRASGSWFVASNPALIDFGASSAMLTLDQGGLWRLLFAKLQLGSAYVAIAFIPFLWFGMANFEREFGARMTILLFAVIAISCSVVSLHLRVPDAISIGAGGPAIAFALSSLLNNRNALHKHWSTWAMLAPYSLILTLGAFSRALDSGSLACGVLCGLLVSLVKKGPSGVTGKSLTTNPQLVLLSIAFLFVAAAGVFSAPKPPYYWSENVALMKAIKEFESRINPLNATFDGLMRQAVDADANIEVALPRLESEVVPEWERLERQWKDYAINPALPDATLVPAMKLYAASNKSFLVASIKAWRTDEDGAYIEAARFKEDINTARLQLLALNASKSPKRVDK